jgi:ankyrin repeat protein
MRAKDFVAIFDKFRQAFSDQDLLDKKDNLGRTAMHLAVYNCNANAVASLLSAGASVNIPSLPNDDMEWANCRTALQILKDGLVRPIHPLVIVVWPNEQYMYMERRRKVWELLRPFM